MSILLGQTPQSVYNGFVVYGNTRRGHNAISPVYQDTAGTIDYIVIKAKRVGSSGDVTVEIWDTPYTDFTEISGLNDDDPVTIGNLIGSKTEDSSGWSSSAYDSHTFTFASPISLPDHGIFIISIKHPEGNLNNCISWAFPTGTGYTQIKSADGGSSWYKDTGITGIYQTYGTLAVNVRGIWLGSGGNFIVAVTKTGVYLSTDFGDNWTRKTPDDTEDTDWVKGICSSDGTYIIVVSSANAIYRSANSGTAWAAITPAGGDTFSVNKLATSDDGQYMVIVGQNSTDATESCYISTDYGATWTAKKPVDASIEWTECDISNDGAIIAVSTTSYFYISLDSGATWLEQGMASSAEVWEGLSISGDGTTGLIANTNDNNEFFIGTNTELYSEATWAESSLTSAGRAILDDADAPAQATTLGLGTGDTPEFVSTTLSDLTASRLVWGNASKVLASKDLVDLITGTENRVTVSDDVAGGVTVSAPQDLHLDATPEWAGTVIKNSSDVIIFYVDDDEMYFTGGAIPIAAGMPIGLALILTYASS